MATNNRAWGQSLFLKLPDGWVLPDPPGLRKPPAFESPGVRPNPQGWDPGLASQNFHPGKSHFDQTEHPPGNVNEGRTTSS